IGRIARGPVTVFAPTSRGAARSSCPAPWRRAPWLRALACALALTASGGAGGAEAHHAIAMHGTPALADGFSAFRDVDVAAPKGGRLAQAIVGTFDSLNPLIVKGLAVSQLRGYVIESLMARGYDEPFTLYGLIAKSVETDAERSYVTFTLDP